MGVGLKDGIAMVACWCPRLEGIKPSHINHSGSSCMKHLINRSGEGSCGKAVLTVGPGNPTLCTDALKCPHPLKGHKKASVKATRVF